MLKVALVLGGPSQERAISLNSARSVADHLEGDGIVLEEIMYFDLRTRAYSISRALLYSNTPSDFDFKLSHTATPLSHDELAARLRCCDVAFPAMHGAFAEDGGIQSLLEEIGVPYLGSGPGESAGAFDKFSAYNTLLDSGIAAIPSHVVRSTDPETRTQERLESVFSDSDRVVLKPVRGGSSIDVHIAPNIGVAMTVLGDMFRRHERVLIQPKMRGAEFTTIVMDNGCGAVALVPVEIEVGNPSHTGDANHASRVSYTDEIFDYRRKYLVSNDSSYHCPPRFSDALIQQVRETSEQVFSVLGLRDFARVDGWLAADGSVVIADVNPLSGMEQNSFLFIQAAQVGMSHRDVLRLLVQRVCARSGIDFPETPAPTTLSRKRVGVIFGGSTAERQVSLLSGTNVWLKLLRSKRYEPVPHLLDPDGTVWRLSYAAALRHTVEEAAANCREILLVDDRQQGLVYAIRARLGLARSQLNALPELPKHLTMDEFLSSYDLVFLGLHGGAGEDGTFQAELDRRGISYNGSGARGSAVCMDKYETGRRLAGLESEGIRVPRRILIPMPSSVSAVSVDAMWAQVISACGTEHVIVKPAADGCSAGVVPLVNCAELAMYLKHTTYGSPRIAGETFTSLAADQVVEMATSMPSHLIFEEFVETDSITVVDSTDTADTASQHEPAHLAWGQICDSGWIEVTVGVLGPKGQMRALSPSVTIARQGVLSVEEKFMGGTGVNLTPPPTAPLGLVKPEAIDRARRSIAVVANKLDMSGYGRIDAFLHRETGEIMVIEANSLPGLTPSTVLFHQALAEDPSIFPRALLETLLDLGVSTGSS